MARFNPKVTAPKKVVNRAGGLAHKQSDKLELVSVLLTNMLQDQFYRKAGDAVDRLAELVATLPDKKFVAKAGIFARTKYGMRSITHVLAGELAKNVKGENWTKSFYDKVVFRPDDMTEILSYYMGKYGKPIPNSLKKGLGQAIQKFNAYQLAKYRGEGKELSLVDLVNICHPKANPVLAKLMKGELVSTDTWEAKLTKAGQVAENEDDKAELKTAAWSELISEKKLGYFALLRNLRNISQQAPQVLDEALKQLVDEKAIKKSLVFPFRFLTAYELFDESRKILKALDQAVEISISNVPKFTGSTLVVLDESGSMSGKPAQIGSLFAGAIWKANHDADFMVFSDTARYKGQNDAMLPLMELSRKIQKEMHFGGTDFHCIFRQAKKAYDRIIILSDMQGWIGHDTPAREYRDYCLKFSCNPFIYSFDLQGYGDMQFPEPNVCCLAGFSDKVFDVMKVVESDKNALIHEIEKVEL
jgi:hypothetical protein